MYVEKTLENYQVTRVNRTNRESVPAERHGLLQSKPENKQNGTLVFG